jgi:hypothetical protein
MNGERPDRKALYFEKAGEHLLLLTNEKLNDAKSNLEGTDAHISIGELLDVFPILDRAKALFDSSKGAWDEGGNRFSEESDRVVERSRFCERDEREVSRVFVEAVEAWGLEKNPTELQRRILAHELERRARGWPVRDLAKVFARDEFLGKPENWGTRFGWMADERSG